MTWDFALGVLVGVITSAGFWAGRGCDDRCVVIERAGTAPRQEPELAHRPVWMR